MVGALAACHQTTKTLPSPRFPCTTQSYFEAQIPARLTLNDLGDLFSGTKRLGRIAVISPMTVENPGTIRGEMRGAERTGIASADGRHWAKVGWSSKSCALRA